MDCNTFFWFLAGPRWVSWIASTFTRLCHSVLSGLLANFLVFFQDITVWLHCLHLFLFLIWRLWVKEVVYDLEPLVNDFLGGQLSILKNQLFYFDVSFYQCVVCVTCLAWLNEDLYIIFLQVLSHIVKKAVLKKMEAEGNLLLCRCALTSGQAPTLSRSDSVRN